MHSEFIDSNHPAVASKAAELAKGGDSEIAITRRCFGFVRDHIRHCVDFRLNPVTCKASEVLRFGTGYCYAKSHLLAALLRANGIPAGLCYQRLMLDAEEPTYCLHGLNAVYLKAHGWYRIDARGNKPGIAAEFCPPIEKLAFTVTGAGEIDLPEIWAEPLAVVVCALSENVTYDQVRLPDVELLHIAKAPRA